MMLRIIMRFARDDTLSFVDPRAQSRKSFTELPSDNHCRQLTTRQCRQHRVMALLPLSLMLGLIVGSGAGCIQRGR